MSAEILYPTVENRFHDTGKITLDKGLQFKNWAHFNFAPALAAAWKLDDATFIDGSPSHYHLTTTGSVPVVAGKIGSAANFTGNAANFLSNSNLIIPVNTPWSISCWVKMHSLASDAHLLGNATGSTFDGWRLQYLSGPQTFALASLNSDSFSEERVISAFPILNETWTHVVATVDASQNGRIYVSGEMTFDEHQFFTDPGQPFRIGNDAEADLPANAAVDSVSLWANRVISQAEVYALWNGGDGRTVI